MSDEDLIFVSIPSYRDPECPFTLLDVFRKARYPHRIRVGVCQQNAPRDRDCLQLAGLQPYLAWIRVLRMSHYEAQGPMLARHLIETRLYQDEMFYLNIDSHTMFVPHWDVICIEQLAQCPSNKPILTTYPHPYDRKARHLPQQFKLPTFLRFRGFHPRLGFTEQEKESFKMAPSQPYPSVCWAAGFSFTLGEAIRQVPYDPYCYYVFVGEEMSMSARYWTHGWDFFTPTQNIVFHITTRDYRPLFWEQVYQKNCVVDEETRLQRKEMEQQGVDRIRALLNEHDMTDGYGLGSDRSLAQWCDYFGLNLREKTCSPEGLQGMLASASFQERQEKWFVPKPTPHKSLYKSSLHKSPQLWNKPTASLSTSGLSTSGLSHPRHPPVQKVKLRITPQVRCFDTL